jgi:hypothetical protein
MYHLPLYIIYHLYIYYLLSIFLTSIYLSIHPLSIIYLSSITYHLFVTYLPLSLSIIYLIFFFLPSIILCHPSPIYLSSISFYISSINHLFTYHSSIIYLYCLSTVIYLYYLSSIFIIYLSFFLSVYSSIYDLSIFLSVYLSIYLNYTVTSLLQNSCCVMVTLKLSLVLSKKKCQMMQTV